VCLAFLRDAPLLLLLLLLLMINQQAVAAACVVPATALRKLQHLDSQAVQLRLPLQVW
jgi:hypothetical protein